MLNRKLQKTSLGDNESLTSIERSIHLLTMNGRFSPSSIIPSGSFGPLGVEASALQLVATWLRAPSRKKYLTLDTLKINELCQSSYGLISLLMSDQFLYNDNQIIPAEALNKPKKVIDRISQKEFNDIFTLGYFAIPCINKLTYSRQFDMPTYNNHNMIEGGAFYHLVKKILNSTVDNKLRFTDAQKIMSLTDLTDILWELFKNSHDHARQNNVGDELEYSFQNLIIQESTVTQTDLNQWLGETPSQAQLSFCEQLIKGAQKSQNILDISMTDLGPGFINEQSDDPSGDLIKLLSTGFSRTTGRSRGYGLTKIIRHVTKNQGWLRIRTNNLLLEKCFTSHDTVISKDNITELPYCVAGASIQLTFK